MFFAGYKIPHPLEHRLIVKVRRLPSRRAFLTHSDAANRVNELSFLCIAGAN